MWRKLKLLVVLAMLALVPPRGVAAMTIGLCALGERPGALKIQAEHGHASSHDKSSPVDSQKESKAPCSVCAEHCGSAALAVPAATSALPTTAGLRRALPRHLLTPGLVPEEPDRPPIAL